jgi:hypothetical protein
VEVVRAAAGWHGGATSSRHRGPKRAPNVQPFYRVTSGGYFRVRSFSDPRFVKLPTA